MDPDKREMYLNVEKQKFTGKRKQRKTPLSKGVSNVVPDKFKCPDCDKPFAFVAPLYIHAATTHYNEQIKAKVHNIWHKDIKANLYPNITDLSNLWEKSVFLIFYQPLLMK